MFILFLCVWPAGQGRATLAPLGQGSLTYHARVIHDNRAGLSNVAGQIDLASGGFDEVVMSSYSLDWQQIPAKLSAARAGIPSIWQAGGQSCQQYAGGLPRYNSPLLRHFLVGKVIAGQGEVPKGATYLSGQLQVLSAEANGERFEIVTSFNGAALVIVGKREQRDARWLVRDIAVLGPQSELYQYFIDDVSYSPQPLAQPIELPQFDAAKYVEFPASGESTPVAIRPVKDWLVLQAQLPSGRKLNLVFDSGAETMILDELVLKLDAHLKPVGELPVAGAYETAQMHQYEGLDLEIGGVKFKQMPVIGTQLTTLAFGADIRIHGIIGSEILQLCQADFDLEQGRLLLRPLNSAEPTSGLKVPLKLINELPHIEADVHGDSKAYLLVDTGQNSALSMNLDYLEARKLGDEMVMDGLLGDIAGGMSPHYKLEKLGLNIGGLEYVEPSVDGSIESTYDYDGLPVAGAIGFPLFAKHFGGMVFDYGRSALYLRDAADNRVFTGSPQAWESAVGVEGWFGMTAQAATPEAANAAPRSFLLPDRSAKANMSAAESWGDTLDQTGDPLGLVRATSPARLAGSTPRATEEGATTSRSTLLMLLRDCAEAACKTLLDERVQRLTAAPAPPAAEAEGAPPAETEQARAAQPEPAAVLVPPGPPGEQLDFGHSRF